jgi:L-lysine 6-transaminase
MEEIVPGNVHEVLKRSILADGFELIFDFERSKGSYLYDSKYDRKYLDFFTFFASMPIGFNHPRITGDEDFLSKLKKVSTVKPSNSDIYTTELAEFVDTFSKVAGHSHFENYFFISGGALAVENALKAAFDWKVRKNFEKGIKDEIGTQVIHFKQAFHGRSGYTLSLTNTDDPRKTMYFPKFNWPRITNPKCVFPLEGENLANVMELEDQAIREIYDAFERNPDDIACIIIEPIQAEGGDIHFRPEFLRELRRIADEQEALLIFDEVQTGIGLTGEMWAFENYDVLPDMIAFGKKTQVCGTAASKRVNEIESVFRVPSRINSTFGGNLTDMVRCTRYLEIIQEENLLENVRQRGKFVQDSLHQICQETGKISNVRGKGLFIAFDLPDKETRNRLHRLAYEHQFMILVCGDRSIRLRPALDLKQEDAERAMEIMRTIVQKL